MASRKMLTVPAASVVLIFRLSHHTGSIAISTAILWSVQPKMWKGRQSKCHSGPTVDVIHALNGATTDER